MKNRKDLMRTTAAKTKNLDKFLGLKSAVRINPLQYYKSNYYFELFYVMISTDHMSFS